LEVATSVDEGAVRSVAATVNCLQKGKVDRQICLQAANGMIHCDCRGGLGNQIIIRIQAKTRR
jgi:hypothetical protein